LHNRITLLLLYFTLE